MTNAIGWCDLTINAVSGCYNNCSYCYARQMAYRLKGRYGYPEKEPFKPTFHLGKIAEILHLKGKGKRIFLDSMSDWWSPGVNPKWIEAILKAVSLKPEHHFLVLTKRPDRIDLKEIPDNLWIGASITKQEDLWRLEHLRLNVPARRFISFEPLHGPIEADLSGIAWAILGAESGNRKGKVAPKHQWVERIVDQVRGTPVFMKDNLSQCLEYSERFCCDKKLQEFPEGMQ